MMANAPVMSAAVRRWFRERMNLLLNHKNACLTLGFPEEFTS
jgi:hypothetical protein